VRRLLVAACLVAGCASIGAPGGGTTVVIPLESGGYVLTAASFHVTGPTELSVSAEDGEAALALDLAPGVYQVELEPGWQLARILDDGSWQPVAAVLAGSAAQTIPVVPGETAEVRFEFLVTGP
jgi:hypothetical protein